MHGLGGSVSDLNQLKEVIQDSIVPPPYVKMLKIGDSVLGDRFNTVFMGFKKQIDFICEMIKADDNLKDGYNAIGFSQGGLIIRGMVQTCVDGPPVIQLITLCSPHQGVYGVAGDGVWRNRIFRLAQKLTQYEWVNNRILQAGYWHDIDPEIYERYSYLAVINNEHEVNYAYRDRIVKLKNFVIVHYSADSVLIPKETQSFGFFKPGSLTEILKMKDTDLYKADKIGLKELESKGKLIIIEVNGDHCQSTIGWFRENIIEKYLD